MAEWIAFANRLPTRAHANDSGDVMGRLSTGEERLCVWNWIPLGNPQAAELWACNGWTHWHALSGTSADGETP